VFWANATTTSEILATSSSNAGISSVLIAVYIVAFYKEWVRENLVGSIEDRLL